MRRSSGTDASSPPGWGSYRDSIRVAANRTSGSASAEDVYLRTLLIHGARAVIRFTERKSAPESWLRQLLVRRNRNVAAVALANKNARTVWALLAHGQDYRSDYTSAPPAAC